MRCHRPLILAPVLAVAAIVLLAAGCGGGAPQVASVASSTNTQSSSSSSSSPASASGNKPLAYSRCMRSNGVPNYPDPNSSGSLPKGNAQTFGVSTSQYQAAQQACANLLPAGGSASLIQCLEHGEGDCPRTVVQPAMEEGLRFARCMRSHGVTNWPDPTIDSIGRPSFQVTKAGISLDATRSPQMLSKIGDCQREPGAVLLRQE